MTDTPLTLANRALQDIGARSIIAAFNEASNEARNVNLIFDKTLREVLVRHRWNFAYETVAGNQVTPAAPLRPPWQFAYQFPTAALRINGVYTQGSSNGAPSIFGDGVVSTAYVPGLPVQWALGRADGLRVLLANVMDPLITYTAYVTDFSQWEDTALLAFEYSLAAKLAIPISGDKTLAQRFMEMAENIFMRAAFQDANEDSAQIDIAPDWLLARDNLAYGAYGGAAGVDYPVLSDDSSAYISSDFGEQVRVV